jgi:glycosyltransferase involved in cell wall biosynthesis
MYSQLCGVTEGKVSEVLVLVPAYNRRRTLGQCFASLGRQSFGDWRVVLVDNASTDGTVEWVREEYSDWISSGRLSVHAFEEKVQIIANWNRCASLAGGARYIKYLWSDDMLHPDYLACAVAKLRASSDDVLGFCSAIRYVSESGRVLGRRRYGALGHELIASVLTTNRVGCPSGVLLKGDAYRGIRFDEGNRYCADMLYLLQPVAARKGKLYYTGAELVDVTVADNTETGTLYGSSLMLANRRAFRGHVMNHAGFSSPVRGMIQFAVTFAESSYFGLRGGIGYLRRGLVRGS